MNLVDCSCLKTMLKRSNIIALLRKLGKTKIRVGSKYIKTQCLFEYRHSDGKDTHPSFIIDLKGYYYCFACHSSGHFTQLFDDTIVTDDIKNVFIEGYMMLNFGADNVSEDILYDIDFSNYEYVKNRGINEEVCKLFEVGYDSKNERVVFVCRDRFGAFVGLQGRTIKNQEPKYMDYNKGLRKHLYRLDLATIIDSVILVEGFMDVLNLFQHGYRNTVCALGTNLTEQQIQELYKLEVQNLLVFFDADQAGKDGFWKVKKRWKGTCRLVEFDKDPADATKEELDNVLENLVAIY